MTTLKVENLHCDACARQVTAAIAKAAPEAKALVDVKSGHVRLEGTDKIAEIAAAITAAGYPAKAT